MKDHQQHEPLKAVGRLGHHTAHSQLASPRPANDNRRHRHTKQIRTPQIPQAIATATPAADSKTAQHTSQLPAFDWRNQWYPVHFAQDLPEGKPQRVYIFDEPIVILKRPGEQGVVALKDRCPHRAAALSEGRMTPDGQLQCAYHGWSFDGESGICTNIPQVIPNALRIHTKLCSCSMHAMYPFRTTAQYALSQPWYVVSTNRQCKG